MNLPLPCPEPGQRYLRFALLSYADGDPVYKHQRVERLYHQSGGSDAAVVWLLDKGGDAASFMEFQIEWVSYLSITPTSHHVTKYMTSSHCRLTRVQRDRLMDKFEMPLIPLQSIEELPVTLMKFHRSFLQSDASTRQRPDQTQVQVPGTGAVQSLLPYCAISPPLGEHSVNLLSDLTVGFADLANKASSEAGQTEVLDYFGQQEAERIILFWTQECLI